MNKATLVKKIKELKKKELSLIAKFLVEHVAPYQTVAITVDWSDLVVRVDLDEMGINEDLFCDMNVLSISDKEAIISGMK